MKIFHYFTALLIAAHFSACAQNKNEQPIDSIQTVSVSFTGDLMCHIPQMDFALAGKDSFDFKPAFSLVKKFLSVSNLTIGNLETTISGKENRYSGYPVFNAPDSFLDAVKDAGFNFLVTSNNHSYDRGEKGVLRTLEKIRSLGSRSSGTYSSPRERDSVDVFVINGIRFAVLSYSYGLNGFSLPKDKKYLVSLIDTLLIKRDIKNARSKKADIVLAYFHFGDEYKSNPSAYQKEIVKKTISYGADIIIGSHPHVIQTLEFFTSVKNRIGKGFVAYSLGNFISNQRWRYSDCGVILNFTIKKDIKSNSVWLSDISYLPTWVFKGKIDNINRFIIIPSDSVSISKFNLSKQENEQMFQAFSDTDKLLKAVKEFNPVK